MKKKIVFLPLDERPCNYEFPFKLFNNQEFEIKRPNKNLMGDKKIPANLNAIEDWIKKEVTDSYGLVISIDTLLYGGIVPSRLHNFSNDEILQKMQLLRELKELNPELKLFAFHLIMRCPTYSSDDEEPDYYEHYGKEIFELGRLDHRIQLGLESDLEHANKELTRLKNTIPKDALCDYTSRRVVNLEANKLSVDLLKEGIIDFLIVPQDDSSPHGFTAVDQEKIRRYIAEQQLQLKAFMYPGADEVSMTLMMRLVNEYHNNKPLIYVRYSSTKAPTIIPSYEDRILNESVKYQVLAAGGLIVDSMKDADLALMVNAPSYNMLGSNQFDERHDGYTVERNLVEFVETIDYMIHSLQKPVAIGDVAYGNGSDLELMQLLDQKNILMKVASYAGWNTSSNTLGTCIPQGMLYLLYEDTKTHYDFLAHRYIEDTGYCAHVRKDVCDNDLEELGFNYFYVKDQKGPVSEIVRKKLEDFIAKTLPSVANNIQITDCYMPWRRMFEVGIEVEYNSN
ncbi:DUF4127 family protein [Haloplasma contractile]|uniref:DUF4127 family protein n=1 Tax=Haloplasma contractile SSD-17B TaxID=1033810 RepID=U2EGA1_9MOLU|nr:DUF4127 family protein [Haloplasma contractile]ERJ13646.1 hypothetical protein HLPCO_000312 [Haloplasma contractile SSD-17B]